MRMRGEGGREGNISILHLSPQLQHLACVRKVTLNPTAPPTLMLPAFMWFPMARTISSTLLKDLLVCSCTDARLMASRSCQIVSINQYVKSDYLNIVTACQFLDVTKTYWFYLIHFFTEVHTKNHCSQTFTIVGNGAHLEISRPLESINQPINQSIDQLIDQSTNQLTNQSINQSTNQLINQSINQPSLPHMKICLAD